MKIEINSFKGEAPRIDASKLPNDVATKAHNTRLLSGRLEAWRGNLLAWNPTKVGVLKTIYLFAADKVTSFWFHWTTDVDVVKSPVIGDVSERTYFTVPGSPPQMTDNSIAVQGGNLYPMNAYDLGLPAPTSAIVAASTPNPDEALNETTSYIYTYVSAYGEESAPSPLSNEIELDTESLSAALSGMAGVPTGNYNIDRKRVYRAASSFSGADYQFVAEIPVGTTTHTDTVATSALGESIVSLDFNAPPATMTGLELMPNGIMVGFDGKKILFSEPYQPHAFPFKYRQGVEYNIVGLGVFGNSVAVLTTGTPYIFSGVHPSSMSSDKVEIEQACLSKRGIVDMGEFIIYPSPDGLVAVGATVPKVITSNLMTQREWQALNPSSIHAYSFDGMYIAFYDNGATQGGFILDPRNSDIGITFIDQYATAGFTDISSDKLYIVDSVSGNIMEWNADGQPELSYTWRSKEFNVRPVNFSRLKIQSATYPVSISIIADGATKHSEIINSSDIVALPSGFTAEKWQIEVTGTGKVQDIKMATSVAEIRGGQ